MSNIELSWGACTDRGLKRGNNQDSFLAQQPVFLVADGMGGHEGGAEASRVTIESYRPLVDAPEITSEALDKAFESAVERVYEISVHDGAAGTTLTGFFTTQRLHVWYWLVINIGDSRVYRCRDGRMEQISIDHSAVQALVDDGMLDENQAEGHPDKNIITRAIGAGSSGTPDYWLLTAQSGDRMLACSDGLNDELSDAEIERVLLEEDTAESAAQRLVHEALVRGGRDNVTAVVVDAIYVDDDDYETTLVAPLRTSWDTAEDFHREATADLTRPRVMRAKEDRS